MPFFLLSSCSSFLFFELVGAGGFGVFNGVLGIGGLKARIGDWMVENKCLPSCCHLVLFCFLS